MIAVVDDDESVRKALLRLLDAAGFASRGFGSGREFLQSWRAISPECLILDLQIPDISGTEVHSALKLEGARIPVIIITARDAPGAREECMARGAVAYLCKPLAAGSVLSAVARAVGSQTNEAGPDGDLTRRHED